MQVEIARRHFCGGRAVHRCDASRRNVDEATGRFVAARDQQDMNPAVIVWQSERLKHLRRRVDGLAQLSCRLRLATATPRASATEAGAEEGGEQDVSAGDLHAAHGSGARRICNALCGNSVLRALERFRFGGWCCYQPKLRAKVFNVIDQH